MEERVEGPYTWKHIQDQLGRANAFLSRTRNLVERGPGKWWIHAYEVKLNAPIGKERTGITVLLYSDRSDPTHPDAKYLVRYVPSTRKFEGTPVDDALEELHYGSRWRDFLTLSDLKHPRPPPPKGIPMP